MTHPNTTERNAALLALFDCARRFPELRICQIIGNATSTTDPYYITDDNLAQALIDYIETQPATSKIRSSTDAD